MANPVNFTKMVYFILRLAPFIIVCFFVLESVFNQEIKGVFYLGGVLVSCMIITILGNTLSSEMLDASEGSLSNSFESNRASTDPVPNHLRSAVLCSLVSLGPISKLPLSQTILSFTFFYLVYIIGTNNLADNNIPTLVIFPILILSDIVWNYTNLCFTAPAIIISFIVSGGLGVLYAYILEVSDVNMQYFIGVSDKSTCTRSRKNVFKCKAQIKTPPASK